MAAMLCPDCGSRLPRRRAGYCPRCGEPAADPEAPCVPCGSCLTDDPPWTHFRLYGVFDGLLRDMLHRAKYASDEACLDALGAMLTDICADLQKPDAVIPLPLHPKRLRQRGYNQCREMAKTLAPALGAPIRDDLLIRPAFAPPQTGLSRRERLVNLRQAFRGLPAVEGLHVLLVDDTATTGTSLRRASRALLDAGARRVDVAVVAHASLHTAAP
ncbi:MAG: ComF family protein [Desulfovibrionaceae bacterium]|nr:ComF family protein [Desulfovibrionaceae bacterium]